MSSSFWEASRNPNPNNNKDSPFQVPSYNYAAKIKTPDEQGLSPQGSFSALFNNISGLFNYSQALSQGGGPGQKVPGALGIAQFIESGAQCKQSDGTVRTRSLYVNTIPVGNIPFISEAIGTNFSEYRGQVPGALGNVSQLNPLSIFGAFSEPSQAPCYEVELMVRDPKTHQETFEYAFLSTADIGKINACWWQNCTNPVTGEAVAGCPTDTCKGKIVTNESFANIFDKEKQGRSDEQILNNLQNIVYVCFFLAFIMILLKIRELFNFSNFKNHIKKFFKFLKKYK